MANMCSNCTHFCVCKEWALWDGICPLYAPAPVCKIGDVLYIPMPDLDNDGDWIIGKAVVTDVATKHVYCSGKTDDPEDTSDSFPVADIGVTVFLTPREAWEYVSKHTDNYQPERCVFEDDCPCGYPFDDCENCPCFPGNHDPYWGMTKGVI